MVISRRMLLAGGSAGGMLLAGGAAFAERDTPFTHGVASGDPHADNVLLWTRAVGPGGAPVSGRWQVARDADFRQIVAQGDFTTAPDRDYIAKIEAGGLDAGTAYHYRFSALGATSPVGRTATLANASLAQLDIALICCAMYMLGEFHAYRAVAALEELDLVLFIGDYIYEYPANSFATCPDIRKPEPAHDTVTLADYRARYAQWRRDPALQAAHARAPWICMWDDHEIANDDWMGGAQHHDPKTQGPWDARKAAAIQAYREWLPIRDADPAHPYVSQRSFVFGDLATLVLPETRLEARDQQLTIPRDLEFKTVDGKRIPDVAGFRAKIDDPARRMVGEAQLAWITQEVEASVDAGRPWLLFGSPTIMAQYNWPNLNALVPATSQARFEALQPGGSALYGMTGLDLPLFNLDSWDGYAAERNRVYDIFAKAKSNLLVLSGDSHMAWVNELHHDGRLLGVEVSATTLSGPSMGELLMLQDAPVGAQIAIDNQDVVWCDHLATGFIAVRVERSGVTAEFISVMHPRRTDPQTRVAKRVHTRLGTDGITGWSDI